MVATARRGSGLPAAPLSQHIVGSAAVIGTVFWKTILTTIDRHRLGVAILFANFGYSGWWLGLTSALIAIGGDTVVGISLKVLKLVG